ncbi:hypothetical protein DSO57_1011575 [Entomophthora muscae]|uniref:Uncharacterized protein n=1 Tax=Entomophthora muscae TaxID=34485 RepID=A0ACC2SV20_9FUNG|nr:hypothetical protein DSO57_1011575 [Entomophthora muscae]
MKEIPTAPLLPNAPPAQDFSKLGFVYITVLGLADQVVPHTGSLRPFATAVNYLVCIAHIVYMAFQAQPASPLGVQSVSGMGHDSSRHTAQLNLFSAAFLGHYPELLASSWLLVCKMIVTLNQSYSNCDRTTVTAEYLAK